MADIRIDTRQLTYTQFSIPGHTQGFLNGAGVPVVSLPPGDHAFHAMPGTAGFTFVVTDAGLVDFPPAHDGFLTGRGTNTLTIRGFRMTLDATALSQGLLPVVPGAGVLGEHRIHELVLAPSDGYRLQPARGLSADFFFDLTPDGQITLDPEFSSFADVGPNRTLVLKGHRVRIDLHALSHGLLPLNLHSGARVLKEGQTHEFTYIPAKGYGFQPAGGVVADFSFDLTPDGQITIDPRYSSFADVGPNRTLVLKGHRVRIDLHGLSHGLTQLNLFSGTRVLKEGQTHEFTYIPAKGYGFQPAGGVVADFFFGLTPDGQITIDPQYATFAHTAPDRTLVLAGHRVQLDLHALSHGLLPLNLYSGARVLKEGQTHEFTYIPAKGYGFQPAGGVVADFFFGLTPDGQITIDPQYATFAHTAPDRTLVLAGHRVQLDLHALSTGLLPLNLFSGGHVLAAGQIHEFTYMPAQGYGFVPGPLLLADFAFGVTPDGQITVAPEYSSFASVGPDRTLVLSGHQVIVDARDLAANLVPPGFSQLGVLAGGQQHILMLLPATRYTLAVAGAPGVVYSFTLTVDGGLRVLDAPGGVIIQRPLPPPATLRSFYADLFMPPGGSVRAFTEPKVTPSLRAAIRDHREGVLLGQILRVKRLQIIDDLFDGATSEQEEDIALRHILDSERAGDLIFLVNVLTWDGLDDDLDEGDLDTIADRLKVLLDRGEYLVGFLLRWFFVVDDAVLPNIDVTALRQYVTDRPAEVRHSFAAQCLSQRDAIRDGVTQMALRNRDTHVRDFRLVLDNVPGPEQHRQADLQVLSWEVFYCDLICSQLSRGEYGLLMQVLTDLFNPTAQPFPARNIALFNILRRLERHLAAMERAIAVIGTEQQKSNSRRYGDTRRLFMDNFPPIPPPAPPQAPPPVEFLNALTGAIEHLQTILAGVGSTFQDLAHTVQDIAATVENISVGALLGTIDDDQAVSVTNLLAAEGLLALLPSVYKSELINRMLDGAVGDDEEGAILTILRDTKSRLPAEFLQLARSASWERLDSSFDGTEHDDLEGLFRF